MGGRGGGGGGNVNPDVHKLYDKVQESWGGDTINQKTGKSVPPKLDAYAVPLTETESISDDASFDQFAKAFAKAQQDFADEPYIGIFHDDVKGTIDFNGATVVKTQEDVDALYEAGNPIPGGAYHFKTGNGYWPQGKPKAYAA